MPDILRSLALTYPHFPSSEQKVKRHCNRKLSKANILTKMCRFDLHVGKNESTSACLSKLKNFYLAEPCEISTIQYKTDAKAC